MSQDRGWPVRTSRAGIRWWYPAPVRRKARRLVTRLMGEPKPAAGLNQRCEMPHKARANRKANEARRLKAAESQQPLTMAEQLKRRGENAMTRRERQWAQQLRDGHAEAVRFGRTVTVNEHKTYPHPRQHTFTAEPVVSRAGDAALAGLLAAVGAAVK